MNITPITETAFTPKKHLGQNFLADDGFARRMTEYITVRDDEAILEIGPGFGALTRHLIDKKVPVFGVEYDQRLYDYLKQYFLNQDNFTVFHHDILTFDFRQLPSGLPAATRFVVVSNVPYPISHRILYWLMASQHRFSSAFLTLQKEVAAKLTAQPSDKDYGPLTIAMGYFYKTRRLLKLAPHLFSPQPAVDSTFIQLTNIENPKIIIKNIPQFFDLLRITFAQRRKMLKNNLASMQTPHLALSQAEIVSIAESTQLDLSRRAETMTREEFIRLSNTISGLKL